MTPHEFRVTSRDGSIKDIVIGGTVLNDRLICSFVDISEHKRFEAELVQARDAAEAANRALQKANAKLQRLVVTGRLTGVWNRVYFAEAVAAEKLRALVADRSFPEVGAVTVSIGVAEFDPHESDSA